MTELRNKRLEVMKENKKKKKIQLIRLVIYVLTVQ